ncbi:hypothetical protein WJX73_003166, partial [Symbiochloris irregularis]
AVLQAPATGPMPPLKGVAGEGRKLLRAAWSALTGSPMPNFRLQAAKRSPETEAVTLCVNELILAMQAEEAEGLKNTKVPPAAEPTDSSNAQEAKGSAKQATQVQEKFSTYAAARTTLLCKHVEQEGGSLADPAHNFAKNFSNMLNSLLNYDNLQRSRA